MSSDAPPDDPTSTRAATAATKLERRKAGDWAGAISLIDSAVAFTPAFLVSCLVADIGTSFPFGVLELGIVLSVYYAGGAVASTLAGQWVDRSGARIALVVAITLSAASALGSALATTWHMLLLMFLIGGCGGGIAGPAAVRLLVTAFAPRRWAMAFALRQSAVPFAAIVVGLFAATVQPYVGWRASLLGYATIAALIAVATYYLGREGSALTRAPDGGRLHADTVALLIFGAMLLGAGISAFSGFVVASGIAIGMSPGDAALLLAGSSVAAIVARLASGWAASKRNGGHLIRVAVLLLLGAIGCVAVALARDPVLFVPAVVAVSATAWSSNALFVFAVVNRQAHAPAKATSIVQLGAFAGSAIGPFVFGFTSEHANARAAWLLLAFWLLLASVVVMLARRTFIVHAAALPPG